MGSIKYIMNNLLKLGKKIFTVGVASTTIFWSLGVAALVPAVATAATTVDCATVVAGDFVKANGADIWVVNADKTKSYFPHGDTFKSWTVDGNYTYKSVDGGCMASFPAAGIVAPRPGAYLLKDSATDKLYVTLVDGKLAEISVEAAKGIYGANYAAAPAKGGRTIPAASGDMVNYTKNFSSTKVTESAPTEGTLVSNGGKYYVIGASKSIREVSVTGLTANKFQTKLAVALASTSGYSVGTAVSAMEAGLSDSTFGFKAAPGSVTTVPSGALTVSLSADSPATGDAPENVSVDFLKLNLTASNAGDVSVNGVTLTHHGLGSSSAVDSVTVYNNGARFGNARDVDSNNVAQINFTYPLVVKAGTTETLVVKATMTDTGKHSLGLDSAAAVSLASGSAGGTFPVVGNTLSGVNVTVGTLTLDDDGTISASQNLGAQGVTLAKFKATNGNVEDIAFNSIVFKRHSDGTASDSAVNNLKLSVDGAVVASAAALSNRYATFKLSSPLVVAKNTTKRFTVTGDLVDGPGKTVKLYVDASSDVSATGQYYKTSSIVDISSYGGTTVTINAGAVSIVGINATNTKIKKNNTNVEFGSFKITPNSGKTVELSTLKLKVASTNDSAGAQIENVEVLLKNNNTVYDLTSSTGNGYYRNTSMGLILNSGVTYEFVVRADTKSTASNGDYTWSINDAAGGDLVLKETSNDTTVTDITPNSVSLNKVSVDTASITFSKNALSSSYTAVVGSSDVEAFNFNIQAGQSSDVKVTQLSFRDANSTTTKSVVSVFKLWKGTDLVKTVSANDLPSYVITFNDLNEVVKANTTVAYRLTTSLVNDSNQNSKQMKFEVSGYAAEETDKGTAVCDTAIDTTCGVVATTVFASARTITIAGYGSLNISVDNTVSGTDKDTYQLAGTERVALGTFKFKTANEDIKVTSLKVVSSADMSAAVSRYSLWDGATEVAYTTNVGATTSTLDQDFSVTGEKFLTLKADLNKYGLNQPGALEKTATFRISTVEAEGVSSGHTLTAGDANSTVGAGEVAVETDSAALQSAVSKNTFVVASKIADVSLVQSSSDGSIKLATKLASGVSNNAAIVSVVVPNTNNTYASGSALKLALSTLKLKVEAGTMSYTATLQRIGGAVSATSSSATTTALVTFSGLASTAAGADFQINPGETAYFLVKVTPYFSSSYAGDTSLKLSFGALDSADFTWTDATSDSSAAKTTLRLPGKTTVDGYLISN